MIDMNLFAEIIPARSAAGFELGMSVDCIGDVFKHAKRWNRTDGQLGSAVLREPDWFFVAPDEYNGETKRDDKGGRYYFGFGAVELKFDSDGILEWIAVSIGYKGKFMGRVGIGDKLKSVISIFDLVYDDVEELHFAADESDVVGIMFQAEEASLDMSPNQEIYRIIIDNQS